MDNNLYSTFLQVREALNIALSVFTAMLCALLAPFLWKQYRLKGYRGLDWTDKICVGLLFLFAGEFLRSTTVWWVIHSEGRGGTYLSDIVPLLLAMICIVWGSLCVIRVMSPERCGHLLWVASATIVTTLIAINYFL